MNKSKDELIDEMEDGEKEIDNVNNSKEAVEEAEVRKEADDLTILGNRWKAEAERINLKELAEIEWKKIDVINIEAVADRDADQMSSFAIYPSPSEAIKRPPFYPSPSEAIKRPPFNSMSELKKKKILEMKKKMLEDASIELWDASSGERGSIDEYRKQRQTLRASAAFGWAAFLQLEVQLEGMEEWMQRLTDCNI